MKKRRKATLKFLKKPMRRHPCPRGIATDRASRFIPFMPGSSHLVGRCLRGEAGLLSLGHVSERMQAGERRSAIFGSWDHAR